MNESEFGVDKKQAMKMLVYLDSEQKHKIIEGKQKWVTTIECISAAGEALAPLLIFKDQNMNTRGINEYSSLKGHFATNKNDGISNDLELTGLTKIFESLICAKTANRQRLLIANDHESHICGDFIIYCMENKIDLLIMPSHCSHIFQPLDVGVFAAFKGYHTIETHAIFGLSSQRISRAEGIELLSHARAKTMSKENILSEGRVIGLYSALLMRVLRELSKDFLISTASPFTSGTTINLDLSLLQSSSSESVELSRSNKRFTKSLHECSAVVSLMRRYAERMIRLCETQNVMIVIQIK